MLWYLCCDINFQIIYTHTRYILAHKKSGQEDFLRFEGCKNLTLMMGKSNRVRLWGIRLKSNALSTILFDLILPKLQTCDSKQQSDERALFASKSWFFHFRQCWRDISPQKVWLQNKNKNKTLQNSTQILAISCFQD